VPSLFIIIPAFNEAQVVGATLAALPSHLDGIDELKVVVVDDGSEDRTAEVVRARHDGRVVLLCHPQNRGLGAALATGFDYARRERADLAVTYDADGQHASGDIVKVIAPLLAGVADVVIGSRLLLRTGMPWHRVVGNYGLNLVTFLVTGLWTTDSQSGLRAFSRHALQCIVVREERMAASSQLIHEVRRHRLRLKEVPIQAIYTDYSLAKGQRSWNAFPIIFRLLLQRLRAG
jgi:glycosyltransferase involved in cell wall biosynthesis